MRRAPTRSSEVYGDRLEHILNETDLSDLDRLALVLTRSCETERDIFLVSEAVALMAQHRTMAYQHDGTKWRRLGFPGIH